MSKEFTNKKAFFHFNIEKIYTAGIVLKGTEVKGLRAGVASFNEAYCYVSTAKEIWLRGLHISPYQHSSQQTLLPTKERKLLLTKAEIVKISQKIKEQGLTLVPLKIFTNEEQLFKVEIGLAKGKNIADKRAAIKNRELKRSLAKWKL